MGLAASRVNVPDTLAIWRRNVIVHLRVWKMNLVAPIIEPIISVVGFGFGIGALVAAKVSGVSYLSFVGAGLLSITVLMRAMFEMTYASYFKMVYQSTYDAILATPVDAESLALGEILWALTHALFDTIIIMIVLLVFGAATSPWAILAPLPLMVGALFMAGLALGITAHVRDIDAFNMVMAIFFSTMYISGAFFPLEVLPVWLQAAARLLPITESIELTRAFLTGHFRTLHIYEAIYLIISAVVACEWAMRSLRRRMVA
ncbi:MAG TPA: ABC transporter permease [Pyrinomonadaceae bacterium]